jgi:hypothetical protein
MKLLNHSIKARILWLLAACVALLLSSPRCCLGFTPRKAADETSSTTTWVNVDDSWKRRLRARDVLRMVLAD